MKKHIRQPAITYLLALLVQLMAVATFVVWPDSGIAYAMLALAIAVSLLLFKAYTLASGGFQVRRFPENQNISSRKADNLSPQMQHHDITA